MALSYNYVHLNKLVLKSIFTPLSANIINKFVHNSDSNQNEFDALDSFTTQLIQKKSDKWENMRIKRRINDLKLGVTVLDNTINNKISSDCKIDIRKFNTNKLNETILELIESQNICKLLIITNQCIEYNICPVVITLQDLLSFFAQNGDRGIIIKLQNFIEKVDPEQFKLNAKYIHYLAEATWIRGNINEALKLFEEVYDENIYLRRKLKLMLKYMIAKVITSRSEAPLVLLINFTENIASKYDDYFLLSCVWQACFLSEWYADQCRATDILNKHKKLCNLIAKRIPFVVNASLRAHQTEIVHRLFELLLKYNMKSHYTFVLQSLFNYRYWQNDLRSCTEIIQWSVNFNINLSESQHEQFLSLLLKQQTMEKRSKKFTSNITNFQFKF